MVCKVLLPSQIKQAQWPLINYVDAAGVGVYGYGLNGGTYILDGTSMAAPYVTSAAAILMSANTSLTAVQIAQAISGTSQALI